MNIFKLIFKTIILKRAIAKAERKYKRTRFHYLVVKFNNKILVVSRKQLKELVKSKKFFAKQVTIQMIENAALYKTY